MTPERAARVALEEAAARAWPPHEMVSLDGWQMRFSGGGSQRANSVQTLHWHGADVDAAIGEVERAYRRRNLTPIFQILDVSLPTDLDDRLRARGYSTVDLTLLMTKRVGLVGTPSHEVTRHDAAPPEWLAIYLRAITPDRRATAPAIIAALPTPRCFFVARREGVPFAVGLGIAEGPFCGVECIATDENARRFGGAWSVMTALEAWSAGQGASTLWLQMLETNMPARRLYDRLGFETVGAYTYRHAPRA